MTRKIRKHKKKIVLLKQPMVKETLHVQKGSIFLNKAQSDRISYSVLRNTHNKLRTIQNISYEINIEGSWEWIVRYDDHAGSGTLHKHTRISLDSDKDVRSGEGIKRYKDKDYELTWVCKDIKRNYLFFRRKFLRNMGIDLY